MAGVKRPKKKYYEDEVIDDGEPLRFKPLPGAQLKYFKSKAKIVFAGGGAGGGKTMALLMDVLRGLEFPGYEAAMFRKTLVMHRMSGGLRAESRKYYGKIPGSKFNGGELQWDFRHNCTIKFYGCDDPTKYDGLQCAFLGVDQVEQLTADEFWHLQSRARSTCGAPIRIRATCNPEPGWLEVFLKSGGYVDEEGYAVDALDGVVKWFVRNQETDEVVWRNEAEDFGTVDADGVLLDGEFKGLTPTSFTFIRFPLDENKFVAKEYRAQLQSMTIVERRKKLDGCWNVWNGGGGVYRADWWGLTKDNRWVPSKNRLQRLPDENIRWLWAWDVAWSIKKQGDWTVGILFGQSHNGWWIGDMIKFKAREHITLQAIAMCAEAVSEDKKVPIVLPKDPGKAGLDQEGWQIVLGREGFIVAMLPDDGGAGDKVSRHRYLSPQAEQGHLKLVTDWRPSASVSLWVASQPGEAGKPVECSTTKEWAREFVQSADALGDGCPHVVTDVTDALARGHRYATREDPVGSSRLALAAATSAADWQQRANDPRAAVVNAAMSQWSSQRNQPKVTRDPRDWLFNGRRRSG